MAEVIVTFKIMPASPDADLSVLQEYASTLITEFGGDIGKVEDEPIAFGLKALKIIFVMDESKGDTEELENRIAEHKNIASVEVVDIRRALG